jgi:predicted DNA-binding antitoxin AbrB/MazE fold protein
MGVPTGGLLCLRDHRNLRYFPMLLLVEAIYENGVLRPLSPLALPEHARVRLSVGGPADDERAQWLAQSEQAMMKVWSNPGDEVFNDLPENARVNKIS